MDQQDPALGRLLAQVKYAIEHDEALEICGGGTKRFYGETPCGEVLDVSGLCGISSYEPTELVVSARAGTPLADLEAALVEHGQCLPFEPPRFAPGGTVGGMVAAGLSGPSRACVGSVRDHVLGLSLLNGRGELLSFGGQVAKNVAGYDVSRLVTGSLGILGVICEVSLKVLPVSVATATLVFDLNETQALAQLNAWASQPLPINATVCYAGQLYVRLSGARAAVGAACGTLGGERVAPERAAAWWTGIRDHSHEFFAHADPDAAAAALWRLSVPRATPSLPLSGEQLIEWNGAQRWLKTSWSVSEVRATAAACGGHATLIRGADRTQGVFTPLSEALLRIHVGLKQAFDPQRIFNPGRLYAGL
jgi:glycolate oxidase FAD binding subunit